MSHNEKALIPIFTSLDRFTLPANLFLLDPDNSDFLYGTKSQFRLFTRTRVILLCVFFSVFVPTLILAQALNELKTDFLLAASSVTTHGEVLNLRSTATTVGRTQLTYRVTYQFQANDSSPVFTSEQIVGKDVFGRLREGLPVEVSFVPDNPTLSRLAGMNTDDTARQSNLMLFGIGLVGTLCTLVLAAFQIAALRNDQHLKMSGRLLLGHVNHATGRLKATSRAFDPKHYGAALRGNYFVEVYYRFRTPTNHEIRQRESRKRNDLLNAELPGPDTPLAVLYIDDKHYKLL
ncbi:MAG TPA: DUF3592 domain-containing protein [Aggregatilineales bacterium]|nr:DUF3592 domain-containing protein [Aggregatilineales bacterium]